MLGWFSAFRENGAPTSYGEHRTPVILDTQIFGLVCLFAIPSIAFLIILPGIRHTKLISSVIFLISMMTGTVLLVGLHYPTWHVAQGEIDSSFKAFSKEKMKARIDVRIGLQHINVSLTTNMSEENLSGLLYNERFDISEVHLMEKELSRALVKGLPYPILKVVEYLSVDRAGFHWGRMYRVAGYYTVVLLWIGTACWTFSMTLLCLSPSHFATSFLVTGIVILSATTTYVIHIPHSMDLRFPSTHDSIRLVFTLGNSFYASLIAGGTCLVLSLCLIFLSSIFQYELDTVFTARRNTCKTNSCNYLSSSPSSSMFTRKRKMSVTVISSLY